jgi:hypothetical protein
MKTNHCCFSNSTPERRTDRADEMYDKRKSLTFVGRCFRITKLIIPSVVLAILPKCPVCLAGYIAVGTGIGVSVTSATYLQTSLIILCLISMSYLAAKRLLRLRRKEL